MTILLLLLLLQKSIVDLCDSGRHACHANYFYIVRYASGARHDLSYQLRPKDGKCSKVIKTLTSKQ